MSKIVIQELQAYLVTQGVGQLPAAAPSLVLPVIYLKGRQGAAAPREANGAPVENVTVTLTDTNLQGPPGVESWLEDCFVAVNTRALNAGEGKLVQRSIKNLLHPIGSSRPGGRPNWIMNTLRVQVSKVWRGDTDLPGIDDGKTYDRVAYYQIRCARSDLA